jgi:hypothetical protein
MDALLLTTMVLGLFALVALVAGVESRDGFETMDAEPRLGL